MSLAEDLIADGFGNHRLVDLVGTARSYVPSVRAASLLMTATIHEPTSPTYEIVTTEQFWANQREQDEFIELVYYAYRAPVFDGADSEDRAAARGMLEDPDPIHFEEISAEEFAAVASVWDDLRELVSFDEEGD